MAITDLTGYTVTVPQGWNAIGYNINLNVEGTLSIYDDYYDDLSNIIIGYNPYTGDSYNAIFFVAGGATVAAESDAPEFIISFSGGTGLTNTSLIQWFEDNNATFTKQEPEPTATFDLSTLNLSAGTHSITVRAKAEGYEASLPSNAVSYVVEEATTYELSGTWVFNENPIFPTNTIRSETLRFTVPTLAHESTTVFNILRVNENSIAVGTASTLDATLYYNNSWESGYDRKIYFDGTQTVDEEFYTWFIANAQPTVSGSYYFNDTLTMDYGGKWFAANFTCNGVSYIAISDRRSESSGIHDLYLKYFSTSTECIEAYTGAWTDEAYRTVDFGSTLQTVSVEFKQWLENNAVKQEETYYNLSGTWVFNDTFSYFQAEDGYGVSVGNPLGFVSNGTTYVRIMTHPSGYSQLGYDAISYEESFTSTDNYNYVYKATTGWTNTNYKTVAFNGTWEVDERAYKWFIDNVSLPIQFTIDGITYGADSGMTWGEWLQSKYNTSNFVEAGLNVATSDYAYAVKGVNNVLQDETITNGYSYTLYYMGGHGGGSWD